MKQFIYWDIINKVKMMKIGPKLAFLLFICTLVNCSESVILGCTPFGVRLALGRNFFN